MTGPLDMEALTKRLTLPDVPPADQVIELALVPVNAIGVSREYQRKISDKGRGKIRTMIQRFDWAKFGALSLARDPEGRLWAVDGQHRLIAAEALGIEAVPAVIVARDTPAAANDFVGINSQRQGVAAIDKFRARVAAGDPDAVALREILDNCDIDTEVPAGGDLKPRQTRAVTALERCVTRYGRGTVQTALETLLEAYPAEGNTLTRFNMMVICAVVDRILKAGHDLDRLDKVLQETDMEDLAAGARQAVKLWGQNSAHHGTQLLLAAVNKGLKRKVA